jgi:hypothetical protein
MSRGQAVFGFHNPEPTSGRLAGEVAERACCADHGGVFLDVKTQPDWKEGQWARN